MHDETSDDEVFVSWTKTRNGVSQTSQYRVHEYPPGYGPVDEAIPLAVVARWEGLLDWVHLPLQLLRSDGDVDHDRR